MLYISKTGFCKAVQCPKILWMDMNMSDEYDESIPDRAIADRNDEIIDYASKLFESCRKVPYGNPEEMVNSTEKILMEKTVNVQQASFFAEGLFCTADILEMTGKKSAVIYVVKNSQDVKDSYYYEGAFLKYCIDKAGIKTEKVKCITINSDYVRKKAIDPGKLINVSDITDKVNENANNFLKSLSFIRKYMLQEKEPEKDLGVFCFEPYRCGYWKFCSRHLPKPNIFDVSNLGVREKFDIYKGGVIGFSQISAYRVLNEKQLLQVDTYLKNLPPHIERKNIRSFLEDLKYPICFLDFETFSSPIPPFEETSPYMQIPFQYSLHIIKNEGGEIFHFEYLGDGKNDPRREIALKIAGQIPDNACVVAYNMEFEKKIIKHLAEIFPDLSKRLININNNMRDIMVPFQKQYYYCGEMEGSYSIKKVLPALYPENKSLDYKNLEFIQDGAKASAAYSLLEKTDNKTLTRIRKNLLDYCRLDTLAMVKIWQKLKEV